MGNLRCANCGFLNFMSASSCKRCKTIIEEPPPEISQQFAQLPPAFQGGYELSPPWSPPANQPFYLPTPIAPLPRVSRNGVTNAGLWVLLSLSIVMAIGIGVSWKMGKSAHAITGWREYRPADNSFTVQMPLDPAEEVQRQPTPAGEIQLHMATGIMPGKGIYAVAYGDYPAAVKDVPAGTLLNAAADGAVNNSGATMLSKKSITLDGYQGIEVEMTVPASKVPGGGRAICRIFWASPRIYILLVGGPDSSEIYESRAKFLDSFRIRKS